LATMTISAAMLTAAFRQTVSAKPKSDKVWLTNTTKVMEK